MNLKVIFYNPYPNGMALTRRIHHYCKGIVEAGGSAQILIPEPSEWSAQSAKNTLTSGTYEGVNFEYTCGTTISSRSHRKQRLLKLKGLKRITLLLAKDRKRTDAVLLITNRCRIILYFFGLCRILGLVYIQEKGELPFVNRPPRNFLQRLYQRIYKRYIYKCFDGIIVVSTSLNEYLRTRIRKNARLLHIPIIADPEEFRTTKKQKMVGRTVVCCGVNQKKDGVFTVVRAFEKISANFADVTLYVIGVSPKTREELGQLVKRLGLVHRVVLTDYISREELIQILCNASVLALAKPSSLQAKYCFPSKLAEYLATGNPVVITRTGAIPRYLQDGVNAFIAEPDSHITFAEKLEFVLANPTLAEKVGQKGRWLALTKFSYKVHTARISSFVKDLMYQRSQYSVPTME